MSNTLYGSDHSVELIKEIASVVRGQQPFAKNLPISVPGIKGQRPTKTSTIIKFLKSEGGFNWGLWRWPSVVQVPESVARIYQNKSDSEFANTMESGFLGDGYWYGRWDGDHRKHIWEKTFPDRPETTCMVYPVESVDIANDLFVKIQKLNQKNLSPEDTIVNRYLSKTDKHALDVAKWLDYCGICIKNSDEGIMPSSATTNTPSTKLRLFEESVISTGLDETKMACDILIKGLSKNTKWNKEISPTLLKGLSILFKYRPATMKNGLNSCLQSFLLDKMKSESQRALVDQWCKIGGNVHNSKEKSLALGLASSLGKAIRAGYYGSPAVASPLAIRSLRENLGLPLPEEFED